MTPHSFRSTFYLWYQLGGGSYDEARLNARHATRKEAEGYWRDSATLSEMLASEPRLLELHAVAPAKSRIVQGNGAVVGNIVHMAGGSEVCTLSEAAKFFVEIMLGVSEDNSRYRMPEYLLGIPKGMNFSRMTIPSGDTLIADLNSYIAPLPPESRMGILRLFGKAISCQHKQNTSRVSTLDSSDTIRTTAAVLPPLPPTETSAASAGKDYKLPNTNGLQNMNVEKKVSYLSDLVNEIASIVPVEFASLTIYDKFEKSRKLIRSHRIEEFC